MINQVVHIDCLLIKRLQNADVIAFRTIYDQYSKDLLGFLIRILQSKEDAEEAVQETFAKLWEKREFIEPQKSLRAYLFTVSLNFARVQLRKRKYNYNYLNYLKEEDACEKFSFIPEKDEFKILYETAVSKLPQARKKIYLLCRHEKLSHKEIALQMNISTKTVENQMTKALRFLHDFLAPYKDVALLIIICLL